MNTTLTLMRRIDPPAPLLRQLEEIGHAKVYENGKIYVEDDAMRDAALNQTITGWEDKTGTFVPGCTVGWGIFDADKRELAFYRDHGKALMAMERAKPVIVTEFELEQESGDVIEDAPRKRKPFEG